MPLPNYERRSAEEKEPPEGYPWERQKEPPDGYPWEKRTD
jgi:hypothetical protein